MLQAMHDKAKNIVTWIIVVLISISFALWGVAEYFVSDKGSLAAEVNGIKIFWYQVDSMYQRAVTQYAQNGKLEDLQPKKLKEEIRNSLVLEQAMLSESTKSGFLVTDQDILSVIAQSPLFHHDEKFSSTKYKNFLANNRLSELQYKQLLREQLMVGQLYNGLISSSFVLDNESEYIKGLLNQQRDFGYTIIRTDKFIPMVEVSYEEIQTFYEKHKQQYKSEPQAIINYIELSTTDLSDKVTFTEDDLYEYYDKHLDLFTTPAMVNVRHILLNAPEGSDLDKSGEIRSKAEDIVARINLGENFEEIVKSESDDPISAKSGGNLGWIGLGEVDKPFEDAAFRLQKPGEISDVVKTRFGYHVIQLVDRKEEQIKDFATVQGLVEKNYRRDVAERQLNDLADELANLTFEYPDSLDIAAEKLSVKVKTSEVFSLQQGSGIASSSNVRQVAFSADVFNLGRNSELIKLNDEQYVVLRIAERFPSAQQKLDEVKESIISDIKFIKAKKLAKEVGLKLLSNLDAETAPYQFVRDNDLVWESKKNVSRTDQTIKHDILQKLFSISKQKDKITNQGFELMNGDYLVISLQKINYQPKTVSIDKDEVVKQLPIFAGNMEYKYYQNYLLDKAKIKLYEF